MIDADKRLRFAIVTKETGRVEIRYFRNPQDIEGTDINLTPEERELFAYALAKPGFHTINHD